MKISYVTVYDGLDIHKWSGTGYFIGQAIKQLNPDIEYIGNLEVQPSLFLKLKAKFELLNNRKYLINRHPSIAKKMADLVSLKMSKKTDVIFSPGTLPIALLESNKPKVFYTDATFAGMVGFYKEFTDLSNESIKHGNFLEQKALDTCRFAIYSSEWAAKSAITHYNISPDKVKVVPFGANIVTHKEYSEIKNIINKKSSKKCNLLFLAVEWERKGGDLALKIAELLNKNGLETELNIVGIKELPVQNLPSYVKSHGFLSKRDKESNLKIQKLLEESHFLLLPSKADCTPIVFSEACSFGLPSITTSVGGIPTIIKDNINGKIFSLQESETAYAEYIQRIFENFPEYKDLAYSSYNDFLSRLNWNVAGKKIMDILEQIK